MLHSDFSLTLYELVATLSGGEGSEAYRDNCRKQAIAQVCAVCSPLRDWDFERNGDLTSIDLRDVANPLAFIDLPLLRL